MNPIEDAIAIWKAGVAAVEPRQAIYNTLNVDISENRILIVGAGKAGVLMAIAVECFLGHQGEIRGVINVPEYTAKYDTCVQLNQARSIGSNFPTEAGVAGSEAMMQLFLEAGPNDLGICLLSGGGSALLPLPVQGVSLADKQDITMLLHASGASIVEMNCIRKHLSRIKGGRLAEAFHGHRLLSLIISDVIGDPLDVIASGPTAPDPSTYTDALNVLDKYDLIRSAPDTVVNHLMAGQRGEVSETPKHVARNVVNQIIASNQIAIAAAELEGTRIGYHVDCRGSNFEGEARVVATALANNLQVVSTRAAILFGGETTVALGPNPGKGGRNQEFVLAMLCELGEAGMKGVTILSAGTDGEDGPTDAAGAIGTEETLKRAKALNLNPRDYLDRHDSYHFFEATGGLFKTGLTGTNVMDLGVILLH